MAFIQIACSLKVLLMPKIRPPLVSKSIHSRMSNPRISERPLYRILTSLSNGKNGGGQLASKAGRSLGAPQLAPLASRSSTNRARVSLTSGCLPDNKQESVVDDVRTSRKLVPLLSASSPRTKPNRLSRINIHVEPTNSPHSQNAGRYNSASGKQATVINEDAAGRRPTTLAAGGFSHSGRLTTCDIKTSTLDTNSSDKTKLVPGHSRDKLHAITMAATANFHTTGDMQQPLTDKRKCSAELELRTSWSKTDQKLHETLQKCRERFLEKQKSQGSGSLAFSGDASDSSNGKPSTDLCPQRENGEKSKSGKLKCPQFVVVTNGEEHQKRQRPGFTLKSRSLLKIKKTASADDYDMGMDTLGEKANSLRLLVKVTRLKVDRATGDDLGADSDRKTPEIPTPTEYSQPAPANPIKITIPTGLNLTARSESVLDEDTTHEPQEMIPQRSFSEYAKRSQERKLLHFSSAYSYVSPSVSSTANILLEKHLSKVAYNFPAVASVMRPAERGICSQRTLARQQGNQQVHMGVTALGSKAPCSGSSWVFLPQIPNHSSSYNWMSSNPIECVSKRDGEAMVKLHKSKISTPCSASLSVNMPPTVSLRNTPNGINQYIQTEDGDFVLNILRSMTISSMSSNS